MNRAIDFANYTAIPTSSNVADLKAGGFTRAIVGCSFGSVGRAQLAACLNGGVGAEAFAWVTAQEHWRPPLDHALAAIHGLPVGRLWLDYEEAALTEARLREAIDYVAPLRPDLQLGIYTSASCWNVAGDFTRYPLWFARYVSHPDPDDLPLFGGWTSAAMWQYCGSTNTCGFSNVDLSLILEEEERMYTDQQIDEKLIRAIAAARDAGEQASNMQIGRVLQTLGALGDRLSALEATVAAMALKGGPS